MRVSEFNRKNSRMSDDFRDLNLDRPGKAELKTQDQLSKHTIEGYLENRLVERALHLLTVGDELQKISVMKNLPALMKEDASACVQRVIPRMHQTLPHGTTEYNMGACEAIRTVAQQNLMTPENFTKVFLTHILLSLESRDTVAAGEWLNVLLEIIQVLPLTVLQNDVLPLAVNKAHISKPVAVRVTSCRIIGRLGLALTPFLVKKDLIPVVISLCQDVSGEVRSAMSFELPNVATTLGMETSSCLLNHVLDLVSDEEIIVRETALQAIAEMLPRFPPEVLKNTIVPLTKKTFSEILKNEDSLLTVLAKAYGVYAVGLKSVMTVAEKGQFLQRYIQMSQLNYNNRRKLNPYKPIVIDEDELAMRLTECRLHCAFNLPAMVQFSSDLKADLLESLFAVVRSLASDSFSQVRRRIAAGFYEVMKMMPRWHPTMKTEFIKLLKDEMDVVLEGLVPHVSNILMGFSASNTLTSDKPDSAKDIGQALFVCEKNLAESTRWRLHEQLLIAFRAVPKVLHPEFVKVYFVPLLLTRALSGRILPCRIAALHTLLVILADQSQSKYKVWIRNKVLELCNNSSHHCRLLFLRGMTTLATLSPEILKELFFHNITSLAEDKVPNVRWMLCKLLPKLKVLAIDPLDRKLLASIDAALAALSKETDKDVLAQLKLAINEIDEIEKTKGVRKSPEQVMYPSAQRANPQTTQVSPLTDMRSFAPSESGMGIAPPVARKPRAQQPRRSLTLQRPSNSSLSSSESSTSYKITPKQSQSEVERKPRPPGPRR